MYYFPAIQKLNTQSVTVAPVLLRGFHGFRSRLVLIMQSPTCQIQHLISITENSDHSLRGFMHFHLLAFNSHLFIILINTSNPLHLFNGFANRTICLYTFWLWLHLIKLCKWIHVKSNTHTWHINSRLGSTSYIMLNWLVVHVKSSYKLITYLCILSWDRRK